MHDIRLIACDLDGTLLDEARRLPAGLPDLVARLRARGVVFCPASGRQYASIRAQFAPLGADLPVIAENGAYVVLDGRELHSACLNPQAVREVVKAARALARDGADLGVVLCGKRSACIERHDAAFAAQVVPYYPSLEFVETLDGVEGDILKVAIHDFESAQRNVEPRMRAFATSLQVAVSGPHWLDVMATGVSKGAGLRTLQEALEVGRDETAAFGDYLNDLEMLDAAAHSYAMANAHPRLRARARHIAAANSDNGVVRAIEAMLAA